MVLDAKLYNIMYSRLYSEMVLDDKFYIYFVHKEKTDLEWQPRIQSYSSFIPNWSSYYINDGTAAEWFWWRFYVLGKSRIADLYHPVRSCLDSVSQRYVGPVWWKHWKVSERIFKLYSLSNGQPRQRLRTWCAVESLAGSADDTSASVLHLCGCVMKGIRFPFH